MKAIETKYLPATARKGSRIVASDSDGNRATISYPHELREGEACHRAAAVALCGKMGWAGPLVGGETRRGWVFVWAGNPFVQRLLRGPSTEKVAGWDAEYAAEQARKGAV